MQWKRDNQTTTADNGASLSGNSIPSPGARSLTYVRTEPKPVDKQEPLDCEKIILRKENHAGSPKICLCFGDS